MADGTIRIETDIDTRKANAKLLQLQQSMAKTADRIGQIKDRMKEIETSGALDKSAEELNKELAECNYKLEGLRGLMEYLERTGQGTADQFNRIADEADALRARMAEIQKQKGIREEYEKLGSDLQYAQNQMTILAHKQREVQAGSSKLGDAFSKMGSRIARIAKQVFIFSVITRILRAVFSAITDGLKDVAKESSAFNQRMSQLQSSASALKASFAAAAAPIISALVPALVTLMDWLTDAVNALGRFFAMITGAGSYMKAIKQQKDFAGSLEDTAKAAKDANGELAGFDDLNVLNKKKDTGGGAGAGGGAMYEMVPVERGVSKLQKMLANLWEEFKRGFMASMGDIDARMQKLTDYATRLKTVVGEIFGDPKVQNAAAEWVNSFMYALGSVAGMFASIGLTIATNLIGGLTQYLENNTETIKGYIVAMFDISTSINEIVAETCQVLAEIFRVFEGEEAIGLTENIIGLFADAFMGVTELAWGFARDVIDFFTAPIIENKEQIKVALEGILQIFKNITKAIRDTINTVIQYVKEGYDNHVKPTIDKLKEKLSWLVGVILDAWNNHIKPTIDFLIEKLKDFLKTHFEPFAKDVIEIVGEIIEIAGAVLEKVMEVIGWIVENVAPKVKPVIETVVGFVEGLLDSIQTVWRGIKTVLQGILGFIKTIFTEGWSAAWKKIGSFVGTIFDGVRDVVKGAINFVIGIINGMISAVTSGINFVIDCLNWISFDIPDWVPFVGGETFGFNISHVSAPQIPLLATGGITTGSTLAVIGEAGKEAVLPLESNTGWMQDLADIINGSRSSQPAIMQVDGRTFARLMVPYIDGENNRIGTRLAAT